MLPEWLLVVSLVILLGYTAQTTLDKAVKVYQKETEAQLKAAYVRLTHVLTWRLSSMSVGCVETSTVDNDS